MAERRLGLQDMNGLLLRVLGGIVVESRLGEDGAYWYRLGIEPGADLKQRMSAFVKDYGEGITVGFPNAFRIRVGRRERRGSPRGRPTGSQR